MKSHFLTFIVTLCFVFPPDAQAQARSTKRGVCWDEKSQTLSSTAIDRLKAGVSWLYNWGECPRQDVSSLGAAAGMMFVPMCWNAAFNETKLRTYLNAHPEVDCLLGFNEPNFSSQANMSPAQAAAQWPKLERIAADYGLRLIAPALNFTGERVDGRTWSPYEWLDEFLRIHPEAQIDGLALHCYMNWYSSNTWFVTEYFYKDLYDSAKTDVYGKYPHIVAFLNNYKNANGRFPGMYLTEFCAWENDGAIKGVDFQIDQMTQKVQKLEQSELVEGYAWFMANPSGGAAAYPYMSILQSNSSSSPLSELGTVYVNMSAFDADKYYGEGEVVLAKDYVDASTDNQQVRLRSNSDIFSDAPLQVELPYGGWASYQVSVGSEATYPMEIRMRSEADNNVFVYVDGKVVVRTTIEDTNGEWADRSLMIPMTGGKHKLMFFNASKNSVFLNLLRINYPTALSSVRLSDPSVRETACYDLSGRVAGPSASGLLIQRQRLSDGTVRMVKLMR